MEVTREVSAEEPEGGRGFWDMEFCWLVQLEPFWPFFKVAVGKLDNEEEEEEEESTFD